MYGSEDTMLYKPVCDTVPAALGRKIPGLGEPSIGYPARIRMEVRLGTILGRLSELRRAPNTALAICRIQ